MTLIAVLQISEQSNEREVISSLECLHIFQSTVLNVSDISATFNNLLNKAITDGIQGITYAMNFEGLGDRNLILDSQ